MMRYCLLLITAFFTFLNYGIPYYLTPISCRDPDVGGTTQNRDRSFLLVGSESAGSGMGNLLIFFPAIYYFAAFTGRDIIIYDNSIIGEMCKIIQCGFPFASEMALAFPQYFSKDQLHHVEEVRVGDMRKYMEGTKNLPARIIRGSGFMPASDWWVYYNTTVHCVHKITGCDLGDIGCSDRHAYQRLVRGPFKSALSTDEEKRITGIPDHVKHAILTLPHSYAPRLDAAIHIRTQFKGFEALNDIDHTDYKKEVSDWLASSECETVFGALESKLMDSLTENLVRDNITTNEDPYNIYLASDNEEVKSEFAAILRNQSRHPNLKINVMKVETQFIHHVKNLNLLKSATNNTGLLDLVFDWYALSLSNIVFAWRKGSSHLVSTFVHSAQRVSGTLERTNPHASIGHGIGTKGYQLMKDKRGNPKWDLMWTYTFLEDYQI